jgi:hypothetical protein
MRRTNLTCAGTLALVLSSVAHGYVDTQRLDVLHRQRDEDSARKEALKLAAEIEQSPAADFEQVWRAARVHCWESDLATRGLTSDSAKKHAQRCWTLGDAASALSPNRAEGFLWAAQGVGLWARANGVVASIVEGIEGKFNQRLDKAIRLDATVDFGSAWLMRGAFFYEAPWPRRDLNRARTMLSAAVERFPDNLSARLYLARIDAEGGNRHKAMVALEKIEAAGVTYDPPAARRVKAEARLFADTLRPR